MDLEPSRTYTDFDPYIAAATSDRERHMLRIVQAHARAEVERSLDGLLATLIDEPEYHFWVQGRDMGPKGQAAVRAYYTDFVLSGGAVLESGVDRLVIGPDVIVQEGYIRNLVPVGVARRRGYAIPDGVAHVLLTYRNLVLWPFADGGDGLLTGEDAYTPLDLEAWEAVPEAELPGYYLDYLAEIGYAA